jgi:hypothetical protein
VPSKVPACRQGSPEPSLPLAPSSAHPQSTLTFPTVDDRSSGSEIASPETVTGTSCSCRRTRFSGHQESARC